MKNLLILVLLMITFNTKAQLITFDNELGQHCIQLQKDSIVEKSFIRYYVTYILYADLSDYDISLINEWKILSDEQKSNAKILWLFTDKLDVELISSNKTVVKNE